MINMVIIHQIYTPGCTNFYNFILMTKTAVYSDILILNKMYFSVMYYSVITRGVRHVVVDKTL